MNVLDLARNHVALRKVSGTKGGEYHGPCPGCGEAGHDPKTGPSDRFHVWPAQNNGEGSYWCRQCGRGGDAVQFLRDFEGLSFHEASRRLNRPFQEPQAFTTPRNRPPEAWAPASHQSPEALWREKASKFTRWAYEQVLDDQEQLDWLAARGIREESLACFGLGWNPGRNGKDLYRAREAWGLSGILNRKTGRPRPLWLPVGMVIPYFAAGVIQRLRIRRPESREFGPPYYLVPGSSMATMVLHPERKAHVIVESELDALLIDQEAGDMVGVVALGSVSAKPDETAARVLGKSRHILNALDVDGAGAKYRAWWDAHFPECERWPVPRGKDPGEAFKQGVNIREWIKAGLPPGLKS